MSIAILHKQYVYISTIYILYSKSEGNYGNEYYVIAMQ